MANNMWSRQLDDWFSESWQEMETYEEQFMYNLRELPRAENTILDATVLYFEVIDKLEKNKDYEHYQEFEEKFKASYAFMTSNYFMAKIEQKAGK
jgi:hypothetical protein